VQGNWAIFAYPTGLIVLGWYAFQQSSTFSQWAKGGLGLSLVLMLAFVFYPSFYSVPHLASYAPPYRFNPFKHASGWSALTDVLSKHGYDPNQHFLFSDKYQTTSILSFYGPGQKRAYFLNLMGNRHNQFSYWPSLQEERRGQVGYFVWVENMPHLGRDWQAKLIFYQNALQRYFERVEFLEFAPLVYEGSAMAKGALIFRCQACKDLQPAHSDRF
jgi:hypothetical protein